MTDQPTRRQRLRAWYQVRAWALRSPVMAVAMLLFAVAAILNAGLNIATSAHQRGQVDRLQARIDCRADLANKVNVIQGRRTAALADGLAAFAENDDVELAKQTRVIHALEDQLQTALDRQADQARICGGP